MLYGEADHDKINGGDGNDLVDGGSGRDKLYGDAGDDTINGGADNDELFGGAGADVFVFETGHGDDKIKDFEDGVDLIDITGLDPALSFLLLSGSINETIAAGSSFLFENDGDSFLLQNNSGATITLDANDFIFDDILVVG